MQKIISNAVLFSSLFLLTSCNSMWGTIQKFEVYQALTLSSSQSDGNGQNESVTLPVGTQNPKDWEVYASESNGGMSMSLVRQSDRKLFSIDQFQSTTQMQKIGSQSAETDWKEEWRRCTYQETYTVCDHYGKCTTYTEIHYGQEKIRYRTTGSYDTYYAEVNSQAGERQAALDVLMDNSHTETQNIFPCR